MSRMRIKSFKLLIHKRASGKAQPRAVLWELPKLEQPPHHEGCLMWPRAGESSIPHMFTESVMSEHLCWRHQDKGDHKILWWMEVISLWLLCSLPSPGVSHLSSLQRSSSWNAIQDSWFHFSMRAPQGLTPRRALPQKKLVYVKHPRAPHDFWPLAGKFQLRINIYLTLQILLQWGYLMPTSGSTMCKIELVVYTNSH